MRSPVNWVVLGMVIERPSHGYEVHQRIVRRFPPEVLRPLPSHVYAALHVLERGGLIEPLPAAADESGAGARRQPKVRYRATPDGARAFRRWLGARLPDPGQRELVQRLALAAGMGRPGLLEELVDAYEDACARTAQALPMPGADGAPARSVEALVRRLTVAAQRAALEAQMSWLRYARREAALFERRQEADG